MSPRRFRSILRPPDKAVFRSLRGGPAKHGDTQPAQGNSDESAPQDSAPGAGAEAVTEVDRAFATMCAGGDAELFELYRKLANSALYVLSEEPDETGRSQTKVFPIEGADYVLVFDTRDRAEAFAEEDAAILRRPGRELMTMLRGQSVGLALNLGDTPSSMLIPGEAIYWICESLDRSEQAAAPVTDTKAAEVVEAPTAQLHQVAPTEPAAPVTENDAPASPVAAPKNGKFKALLAPRNFPDTVSLALNEEIRGFDFALDKALLLWAEYLDGKAGFLVAFSGVDEAHRVAAANGVKQALTAAERMDVAINVAFFPADDPALGRIGKLAMRLNPDPQALRKKAGNDRRLILRSQDD